MNIMLTSVGRRSYMIDFFKSALDGKGLVFASNSEATYALTLADEFTLTPKISDDDYIHFLLEYCVQNEISAIIPLFDIDVPVLARNKYKFQAVGINVIVSDEEVARTCNDKWLTYKFLELNGFSTARSFLSLPKCLESIQEGIISYPVIIKPRWGMGSIGIFEADNKEELEILYKKVKNTISKTYLKFESEVDLDKAVIVQEKLPGEEYGLDIFNDFEKNHICTVPKRKIAMRSGETDIAEIVDSPILRNYGKKLSEKIGHIGNLDVDLFISGENVCVLEMNARFGGQYPFSHLAGVNFPAIITSLLEGNDVKEEDYTISEYIRGYKDINVRKECNRNGEVV